MPVVPEIIVGVGTCLEVGTEGLVEVQDEGGKVTRLMVEAAKHRPEGCVKEVQDEGLYFRKPVTVTGLGELVL